MKITLHKFKKKFATFTFFMFLIKKMSKEHINNTINWVLVKFNNPHIINIVYGAYKIAMAVFMLIFRVFCVLLIDNSME